MIKYITVFFIFTLLFSCSRPPQAPSPAANSIMETTVSNESGTLEREAFIENFWTETFFSAELPEILKENIIYHLTQGPDFVMELLNILEGDPYLYILVDKKHSLGPNYAPLDLVELTEGFYRVTRQGHTLRRAAVESLEAMAAAARNDGVTLIAASAYRSYDYQEGVYTRLVGQMGRLEADRVSAAPGHSQHQLGLVLDFFPIDDSFASTAASAWLERNAVRFGWSLSYPDNYEDITGYRWESWHYRYLGRDLAAFTEKYFNGIQQYALQFIQSWLEAPVLIP